MRGFGETATNPSQWLEPDHHIGTLSYKEGGVFGVFFFSHGELRWRWIAWNGPKIFKYLFPKYGRLWPTRHIILRQNIEGPL